MGIGTIMTFGTAWRGLATWATLQPGPAPRIYDYSLAEGFGWGVGEIATVVANRRYSWSQEKLSSSTLEKIDKTVSRVVQWCNFVQSKRAPTAAKNAKIQNSSETKKKEKKELPATYWNIPLRVWHDVTHFVEEKAKWGIGSSVMIALEKSARLAAYKVEKFFQLKTFDLSRADGYNEITTALNKTPIFSQLLSKKVDIEKKNKNVVVEARIKTFYQEFENILRESIPPTGETPTWAQTIGFGAAWATQFGISWGLRLYAYNYVIGFVPEDLRSHWIALFAGGLLYSKGLATYARGQINSLRTEMKAKKLNCKELLTDDAIRNIVSTAKEKFTFLNEHLKPEPKQSWDLFEGTLKSLSIAKQTIKSNDDEFGLGYHTDSEGEETQEVEEKKEKIEEEKKKENPLPEVKKEKEEETANKVALPALPFFSYLQFKDEPNTFNTYEKWIAEQFQKKEIGPDAVIESLKDHVRKVEQNIETATQQKQYPLLGKFIQLLEKMNFWIINRHVPPSPISPVSRSLEKTFEMSAMQEVPN